MLALEIQDFDDFVMEQKTTYPLRNINREMRRESSLPRIGCIDHNRRESWISNPAFDFDENNKFDSGAHRNRINGEKKQRKVRISFVKPMEFDELLPHVGQYGVYQVYLFLMTMPFLFILAFMFMNQMFITLTPNDYYCTVPGIEKTNFTTEEM